MADKVGVGTIGKTASVCGVVNQVVAAGHCINIHTISARRAVGNNGVSCVHRATVVVEDAGARGSGGVARKGVIDQGQ